MPLRTFKGDKFTHSVGRCPVCGEWIFYRSGRGRLAVYCSDACKAKAYRRRKAEADFRRFHDRLHHENDRLRDVDVTRS